MSIPIEQAIRRAIGQQVDESFLGTLKQAGIMIGTRIGFYVLGEIGRRAFTALRGQVPNVQRVVATTWRQHERLVTRNLIANNPGANIGRQVTLDVTNTATGQTVTIKIDNLVPTPNGFQLVDAKFSRTMRLADPTAILTSSVTRNQALAYQWISSGQPVTVIPRGARAVEAGLQPGVAISVVPSVQLHVNGPAGVVIRNY